MNRFAEARKEKASRIPTRKEPATKVNGQDRKSSFYESYFFLNINKSTLAFKIKEIYLNRPNENMLIKQTMWTAAGTTREQ